MKYNNLKRCVCCESSNIEEVFHMDNMPLAGEFSNTKEDAKKAILYPFHFLQCLDCGTVFCRESLSIDDLYSKYNYSSSTIGGLVKHFESLSKLYISQYDKEKNIVFGECGSNDGVLLNQLPLNWTLIGIDPSDVARNAKLNNNKTNWALLNQPLNKECIVKNNLIGKFDVFSGSNCFSHFESLKDAFEAVFLALKDNGEFWLEVKSIEPALKINRYTDFYIEHLVSHSEESLKICLGKIGFNYISSEVLPFHGGLLRIKFKKEEPKQDLNNIKLWIKDFKKLQFIYDDRYNNPIIRKLIKSKRNIAFGASGECNTFLNHFKDINFEYVIDDSPIRQNKFIPQVAVPIYPKGTLLKEENDLTTCLISAWTYKKNIIKSNPEFKGQWLAYY